MSSKPRDRRWVSTRYGSEQIGIASKHPFAVLLVENRQCVTGAGKLLRAGRRDDDGELGPHKRPVAKDFDFLNLTRTVKSRRVSARLRTRCGGKVGLA